MSEWDTMTWVGFIFTLFVPLIFLASVQLERGSGDDNEMT